MENAEPVHLRHRPVYSCILVWPNWMALSQRSPPPRYSGGVVVSACSRVHSLVTRISAASGPDRKSRFLICECGEWSLSITANLDDRRMWCAGPTEAIRASFANVDYDCRPEANKTNSSFMSHAGINQSERSNLQESLAQSLRNLVACRIERRGEFPAAPQIMKLTCKIGQVFVVGRLVLVSSHL